ncbi:RWD domain-containing protein 1 [Artemisia annua]|uniref:RWD domain-containing protein 1 n=1 Tax=Artemisia annua TaxID=35608 RepID=A0A2U1KWZ9_ARTAN|nr:RWD domain-containing protein 1 [Artemisia annua]
MKDRDGAVRDGQSEQGMGRFGVRMNGNEEQEEQGTSSEEGNDASENLGMAMFYTLVSSAKDWHTELFARDNVDEEVIVPHGEPLTIDTFLAWREDSRENWHLKEPRTADDDMTEDYEDYDEARDDV